MTSGEREERIRRFFPLVKRIARRVQRILPSSDANDLVGDGCIGLIRAVDTYDESRGPTFERYASRVIAGAMLNGLRRLDPVSERVRRELRQADRERYAIAAITGAMPTQREMEERRPALRRAQVHAHRYTPLSLDAPLPPGERVVSFGGDPALLAASASERRELRSALHRLPPRQQHVLTMHYFEGCSLHHIGRTLAISAQRASQLHQAALKNLRKVLHVAH